MLKIGDVVANYKIVDIRGGMVLGVNPNRSCPQPYAFWYLDSDGCGVHWGSYFNCGELAERLFHNLSKCSEKSRRRTMLSRGIRRQREKSNMTQKEVSERLNISRAVISQYESGAKNPSVENLIALADFFNCSLDELCERRIS